MNIFRMGNYEYRKSNYETAIAMYNKGLCYINDTFVLYLNRCACFIKYVLCVTKKGNAIHYCSIKFAEYVNSKVPFSTVTTF